MSELDILNKIAAVLQQRKQAQPESSYVASLYHGGDSKILAKIDEEAKEVLDAAKGNDPQHLVAEIADLWFHCMVLLADRNINVNDVCAELDARFGISGHEEKAQREH